MKTKTKELKTELLECFFDNKNQYVRMFSKIGIYDRLAQEEILSDAQLKLLTNHTKYKKYENAKMSTWLYKLVYRVTMDYLRKKKQKCLFPLPDNSPDILTTAPKIKDFDGQNLLSDIGEAVKEKWPTGIYYDVYKLKLKGYCSKEISKTLKRNNSTIKVAWFRIKGYVIPLFEPRRKHLNGMN